MNLAFLYQMKYAPEIGIPEVQIINNNQKIIKPSGDEIVLFEYLPIEEPSSCITNIRGLGRFDNSKKGTRTILLTVDNAWTARKILDNAPMLREFQVGGNAISISKSLSNVDQERTVTQKKEINWIWPR